MRVTCPNCGALYELPEIVAARARRMRCGCCEATWPTRTAPPPAPTTDWEVLSDPVAERSAPGGGPDPARMAPSERPATAAEPDMAVAASASPASPASAGAIGTRRLWAGAWAGTGVFLAGTCAAFWHWQGALTRIWPPLGRVFAGLHGVV